MSPRFRIELCCLVFVAVLQSAGCVGKMEKPACNQAFAHIASCIPGLVAPQSSSCDPQSEELLGPLVNIKCSAISQMIANPQKANLQAKERNISVRITPVIGLFNGNFTVGIVLAKGTFSATTQYSAKSATNTCNQAVKHYTSCIVGSMPMFSDRCEGADMERAKVFLAKSCTEIEESLGAALSQSNPAKGTRAVASSKTSEGNMTGFLTAAGTAFGGMVLTLGATTPVGFAAGMLTMTVVPLVSTQFGDQIYDFGKAVVDSLTKEAKFTDPLGNTFRVTEDGKMVSDDPFASNKSDPKGLGEEEEEEEEEDILADDESADDPSADDESADDESADDESADDILADDESAEEESADDESDDDQSDDEEQDWGWDNETDYAEE
jgi:hypothetical protein